MPTANPPPAVASLKPNRPHQPRRPGIRKLGTIDCDVVETTPFVFGGRIYRLEWVRTSYRGNRLGIEHLAEAVFDGTLREFLQGWFPSGAKKK